MQFEPKLIMFVMPSERETLLATTAFHEELIGLKMSRTWTDEVKVFYAPISIDATMFAVEWRHLFPGEEKLSPFPVYAVDDLDQYEEKMEELGGTLIGERFELPIAKSGMPIYIEHMTKLGIPESLITDRVGVMRRMYDPNKNLVCLLQPDPHSMYAFKLGPYRVNMTIDQIKKWEKELEDVKRLGLEPVR